MPPSKGPKKKQKTETGVSPSSPGFWNEEIHKVSKIFPISSLHSPEKFALNVKDTNQKTHKTWFQTRTTCGNSNPLKIVLTKKLKSSTQVNQQGKILPPTNTKPITLKNRRSNFT